MASSDEPRTTLTGKPIQVKHEPYTSMMAGDMGFIGDNAVGANLAPPGPTDNSLVRIPIKHSDLEDTGAPPVKEEAKKKSFFRKLSGVVSDKSDEDPGFKIVFMRRGEYSGSSRSCLRHRLTAETGDYLKYWIKDEQGHFLPSVEEPPEGRKEWVRKQLEIIEQWKKDNPKLGAKGPRDSILTGLGNLG